MIIVELGELAEMVVYQGPLVGFNMTLGATGFWEIEYVQLFSISQICIKIWMQLELN